ncbi:hypothetical protein FALCPG4_012539 [Fusarium falciforme]
MDHGTTRTREACEPCRRKKSKCTGEKPTCSFCQRLGLSCVYLSRARSMRRGTSNGVTKKLSTKDRIQMLESKLIDLSGLLRPLPDNNTPGEPDQALAAGNSQLALVTDSPEAVAQVPDAIRTCNKFTETSYDPPPDALNHFVQIYKTTLHLQPLPLFHPDDLWERMAILPQFLLHSFLALMLKFSSHEFYHGEEVEAASFYNRLAADVTMRLAFDGAPRLEVIQALCLLTLRNIAACMTTGAAARLDSLRRPQRHGSSLANELDVRCFWSVYMLETIFFPHVPNAPEMDKSSQHPPSVEPPPPIPYDNNQVDAPDLDISDGTTEDLGINRYCVEMISVWGKVASLLHRTRLGEVETPWLPGSTFSRLNVLLYEYEAQLHHKHLLRNLFPSKRSSDEICSYLEYWHPWLTMHMTLHASLALMNHPFIHLVALRRKKGVYQSRLFLQQVIDQALLHTGWVVWLVDMFKDASFEIYNPLLGSIVAAIATIPWLYQFAKDNKVSRKAVEDLDKCEMFLQRLSFTWPHISRKLDGLRKLKLFIADKQQDVPGKATKITVPSGMLWELLDPSICDATLSGSQPPALSEASIHVTTHFLHPLADDNLQKSLMDSDVGSSEDVFTLSQDDLQGVYVNSSVFPFDYNIV